MRRGFAPLRWITSTWRAASLRTQLVVITSVLMMATVFITALLTSSLYRQELMRQIDEDIHANAGAVSTFLITLGSSSQLDSESVQQSIVRFYAEAWDNEGNVTVAIRTRADSPEIPPLTEEQVNAHGTEAYNVPGTADDSRGWRVQLYRLESGAGSIAIALPLDTVYESADRVTSLVVTIGLFATLGASLIAYTVVTHAFGPFNRVERTAAAIAAGDLSQRITNGPPDTEVGRLSRSLNAMLARIETAFRAKEVSENKMRRFIQDASHELRTPLVTIRGYSELYRHGGIVKPDDVATAMSRIESESTRMTQLVEDLLTLARLDEQRPLEPQPLDLLMLATDAVVDTRVNAPERTISLVGIDSDRPVSAPTTGDEHKLRQVILNLVTNALRYTPEGTPLEIAVGTVDVLSGLDDDAALTTRGMPSAQRGVARDAVIEIRDHGPGISEEDANRIFERFYRADTSRHRETGGTGLGLAIVAAIVAQHDGSVRLSETPGGGATMSVRLPWHPMDDGDDGDDGDDADDTDDGDETGTSDSADGGSSTAS